MDRYLFGAVYILEQDYTDEEIRKDLKNMKDCGYNLITLWPVGNAWLAKNSHEWIFAKTREVLDICDTMGMKAILQLFGQNQSQEFMPDSVMTEECMIRDEMGETVNENCFWANLNHPVVRDYIELFFKNAILSLKDHPAVYGWDVFNEAHFRSDDLFTWDKYRKWLERKYGSIEELNRRWYRRYETFSQISPLKRRSAYSIWSSLLPDVEYEKFRSENLTEICSFLYETAKKYDSGHPVIIDGTSAHLMAGDVTLRNNDEFATAYVPDIYGATFYPKSWGRNYKQTPWTMAMYYSIPAAAARSAGRPYLVNELQTHTQSVLTPGSEVEPEELCHWIWMNVFQGCQGMQLWRWRPFLHGYQSTGRGLTRIDGTPNGRSRAAEELLSVIRVHQEQFEGAKVGKPVVRMAVSYENRLFFDSLLKWKDSFWSNDAEGWYKLFWHQGIQPEFTDLEHLTEEDLTCPVMVLPAMVNISAQAADKLEEYVKAGGILIGDARMASINEYGEVPGTGIPGSVLSAVFGVTETDVESGKSFMAGNTVIPAAFMSQRLEILKDTSVLWRMEDGAPAVTLHHYGKGKAMYFNSFVGMEIKREWHEEMKELVMEHLLSGLPGIKYVEKPDTVHSAFMDTELGELILLTNFSEIPQTAVLKGAWDSGCYLNLMTGEVFGSQEIIQQSELSFVIPSNTSYVLSGRKRGE